MEPVRLRLGELLVDARIISREQLEKVLELQKSDGRRLGTLLVEHELVNETQLTQILSQQLSVPWVSLYHVDFSKRLLGLVPTHVAQKYCLVPIYVRHVRGQGDTLYVAMDDPTNVDALRECASWSGLPTRAMIASPADIRHAVEVYYGVPMEQHLRGESTESDAMAPERQDDEEASSESEQASERQDERIPRDGEEAPAKEVEPDGGGAETAQEAAYPDADAAGDDQDAPSDEPEFGQEAADSETATDDVPGDEASEVVQSSPPPSVEPLAAGTLDADEASAEPVPERRDSIHEVAVEDDAPPVVEAMDGGRLPEAESGEHDAGEAFVPGEEPGEPASPEDDDISVEVGGEMTLDDLLAKREGSAPEQDAEAKPYKRSKSGSMLSLTLLDGTTLALPVQKKARKRSKTSLVGAVQRGPEAEEQPRERLPHEGAEEHPDGSDELTVRTILAALRAASHGADSSDLLGRHAKWEAMTAVVLAILVRKGLITEEELLEEMRKF